jgi:quinone-modifying oxidoreductase, subunit QmoC
MLVIPEPKFNREADLHEAFLKQVHGIPNGEKIKECIQCGTCTGACPVSAWMDITPRQIVALFRAGMIEEILQSRAIWICASCYSCRVRCPSGILVTDMMYALKRLAMDKKIYPDSFPVHALSKAFIDNIYNYGRNFELGLIIKYFLKADIKKMIGNSGMGMSMIAKGRMGVMPKKISKVNEVRAIIDRAKQLEGI